MQLARSMHFLRSAVSSCSLAPSFGTGVSSLSKWPTATESAKYLSSYNWKIPALLRFRCIYFCLLLAWNMMPLVSCPFLLLLKLSVCVFAWLKWRSSVSSPGHSGRAVTVLPVPTCWVSCQWLFVRAACASGKTHAFYGILGTSVQFCFISIMISPWYNRHGSPGVKNQLGIYLSINYDLFSRRKTFLQRFPLRRLTVCWVRWYNNSIQHSCSTLASSQLAAE